MMSTETQKNIAHLYFRQGLSLRKIATELGIHRDTVKKYVSVMQDWLDERYGFNPKESYLDSLVREIEKDRFTEGKVTETFLKFVEAQYDFLQPKTRMELFDNMYDGSLILGGETVHVNGVVGYSTLCQAIKTIEERKGRALFPKITRWEREE